MCGTVAWLQGNTYRDDEQFDLAAWFPSLKYRNPYGGQKHIRMNEKKLVNMVLALTCLLLSPTLLSCSSNDEDEPMD